MNIQGFREFNENSNEQNHTMKILCYSERDKSDTILYSVTIPSSDIDSKIEYCKKEIERYRKGAPFTRNNFRILVDDKIVYFKKGGLGYTSDKRIFEKK